MARSRNSERKAIPSRTFFIDSENNIHKLFEGMELLTASDAVAIFHRDAFPKNLRAQLEATPAKLEWIKCVDAGVKNSMDVQIIAEFAMRVAKGTCRTAYIVSEDNGFSPAIHYLQRAVSGERCEMAHVKSIEMGIARSIVNGMETLKAATTVDEVRQALARVYGDANASALTERLAAVFSGTCGDLPAVESCTYEVAHVDDAEEADCRDIEAAEVKAVEEQAAEETPEIATEAEEEESAEPAPKSRRSRSRRSRKSAKAESDAPEAAEKPEPAEETLISLKGIGKTAVAKLNGIGIDTPSQLREAGAVQAWTLIKLADEAFAIRWLYAFDAAIEGVGPEKVTRKRRAALKAEAEAALVSMADTGSAAETAQEQAETEAED